MRARASTIRPQLRLVCIAVMLAFSVSTVGQDAQTRARPTGSQPVGANNAHAASRDGEIASCFQLAGISIQELSIRATAGGRVHSSVTIDGRRYTLSLEPSVVRAPGFRVLVDHGAGPPTEVPSPPSRTYRGSLIEDPGSVVAASLHNGQLTAVIRFADGIIWAVQPVTDAVPTAPRSRHVVFREVDTDIGEWACGSRHHRALGGAPQVECFAAEAGAPPVVVAELALDADFEFFQRNGGSVDETEADIESIINGVNVIYQNQLGLTHEITTIVVRKIESDPYSQTDSNLLLDEFIAEWNLNQVGIVRDVAHLMTGKDLDANIIGIAEVESVCSAIWLPPDRAYALSQSRFTISLPFRVALTAHELGHTWAAVHCDGEADCSIMCSFIGGCSGNIASFGATATTDIINHRGFLVLFVGCLDQPTPMLELVAADGCLQTGGTTSVTLRMSHLGVFEAAGYRASLSFDPTRLSLVSGTYTSSPFGTPLSDPITATDGEVDLAAEIDQPGGQSPTTLDADIATLTFEALAEICGGTAIRFGPDPSVSEITDVSGTPVSDLVTVDTPNIVIDATAPDITCPADIAANTDPGGCTAAVGPGSASITDICDYRPVSSVTRGDGLSLGDPYPLGITTITWRATDFCTNVRECQQQVNIVKPGDFDGNCTVDELDFGAFQTCFFGPGQPLSPTCDAGDFDKDRDIDLYDWTGFQSVFTKTE